MKQRQLAVLIFHKITPIWDKCQREKRCVSKDVKKKIGGTGALVFVELSQKVTCYLDNANNI